MITRYKTKAQRRKVRVRSKIKGTAEKPRLTVFRSNKQIYAQVIDDTKGVTLVSANSLTIKEKTKNNLETAKAIGIAVAQAALAKKIKKVVFDRGALKYHGRVKALAESARSAGLKF